MTGGRDGLWAIAVLPGTAASVGAPASTDDPAGPGAVVDAVRWLSDALTGAVAGTIAVLAVAALAIVMLQGRLPFRRGGAVLTGCFILFSSRAIAAGLLAAIGGGVGFGAVPAIQPPPAYVARVVPPVPYDPYAGASVPSRPPDGVRDLFPSRP